MDQEIETESWLSSAITAFVFFWVVFINEMY